MNYNIHIRSLPTSCKNNRAERKDMEFIEKLWSEGLVPSEMKRRAAPEYKKQLSKVEKISEQLFTLLSEDEKKLFENYMDSQAELFCMDNCEIFASGFRIGARIMLEVMSEKQGKLDGE